MRLIQFPRPLARNLALLLCFLCLMAPIGNAAQEPGRPAASEPAAASARTASTSGQPAQAEARELTPRESAELSARAEEPGSDVVGGALSNTELTYIVIALAAAVIVLIAK